MAYHCRLLEQQPSWREMKPRVFVGRVFGRLSIHDRATIFSKRQSLHLLDESALAFFFLTDSRALPVLAQRA
jgi:hypothetical protein